MNNNNSDPKTALITSRQAELLSAQHAAGSHSSHNINLSASPSVEREPALSDYIAVIRKRRSLVLKIIAACVLAGILFCLTSPKLYTATTRLEIRGYAPVLAGAMVENMYGADTRKIEYQKTTVAKLKLVGIADEVLSNEELSKEVQKYIAKRNWGISSLLPKWFKAASSSNTGGLDPRLKNKPSLIQSYLKLIDINPVHETNLVEIAVTAADRRLAQKIANAHGETFIEHLRSERQEVVLNNLKLLQIQADELKTKVAAAEAALGKYADSNELIALANSENDNFILRQISHLTELLGDATNTRVKTESLLKEADRTGALESTILDDEALRDLRFKLKEAQSLRAGMTEKYTDAHPEMSQLRARVQSLKLAIAEDRMRKLQALRAQFDSSVAAEQKLREQIEFEKNHAQDVSKRLIQYNILLKESQSLRDLYQTVLRQMQETQVSSASTPSNVFVTDYAMLPTHSTWPKTNLIVILSLLIGCTLGICTAILLEFLNNTIETENDTQEALSVPLLGSVPSFSMYPTTDVSGEAAPVSEQMQQTLRQAFMERLKTESEKLRNTFEKYRKYGPVLIERLKVLLNPKLEKKMLPPPGAETGLPATHNGSKSKKGLITISSPQAIVSEALRTIRASILLSSVDNPPRVVLVTSCSKGEGKTTVVSNLAITLAQAGHKTLLVDADLRQPQVGNLFGVTSGTAGVVEFLAGQKSLGDVIQKTSVSNLNILTAGSRPPNPAEILGSRSMSQLIDTLKKEYDFVLIDSPPVLPVADSLMLSRIVDSVVLVLRSNKTPRQQAQEARRRLLGVNARILGVVLNDLDTRKQGKDVFESYYYGDVTDLKKRAAS